MRIVPLQDTGRAIHEDVERSPLFVLRPFIGRNDPHDVAFPVVDYLYHIC